MSIIFGILIPFIGTTIGSAMVYFMKKELSNRAEKILLGFASGVMVAASIWSLIIPSIEMSEKRGFFLVLPVVIGFILGIVFLIYTDKVCKKIKNKVNARDSKWIDVLMITLAITMHNIPEGMAVGVIFASTKSVEASVPLIQALIIAIGVAIQNIPEGAIISLPLKNKGMNRNMAFLIGTLSGIVEPIAAVITVILMNFFVPLLPYFLAFAAGAMFYVVINELIPETNQEDGTYGTIGFTLGFLIMMILDVVLG